MDDLIGVIFLLCLGAVVSSQEAAEKSFKCLPASDIQLQWKTPVSAFICRFGSEEFVLASNDLTKYSGLFQINVKSSDATIQRPSSIVIQRMIPISPARALIGFGGSSSSSSNYEHYQEQHHNQHNQGGFGGGIHTGMGGGFGVGSGTGVGIGMGVGGGFGIGVGGGFGGGMGIG